MSIKKTVIVQKEEDWYVSRCLENNVTSQGITVEDALANLREAIELYYEDEKPEIANSQMFLTTMEVAI